MNYSGERFLLGIYRDLYNKKSVKKSGDLGDTKFELIRKYLDRIENSTLPFKDNNEELKKYIKNRYYDRYVIKYENISKDYSEQKKKSIIENQKKSLDLWIDFLMNDQMYPMWLKYWTLKSITKMGKYDKVKEKFSKRTKNTISSFPEFNSDIIINLYEYIINYINGNCGNDNTLNKLIEDGNFSNMYAYSFENYFKNNINYIDGIWKKYSYSDFDILMNDISNKNTGWCITDPYDAVEFLKLGDFNIYFLKDKNNNYTLPRVCIRDVLGSIMEIRGILPHQNVEYALLDLIDKKLEEYPNGDQFKPLVFDAKKSKIINEKINNNIELNREELIYLYEIKRRISYFGRISNIDVSSIKEKRDIYRDLSDIFMIDKKSIGTNPSDLQNPYLKCYYGDIIDKETISIKDFYIPEIVVGSIVLPNIKNSKPFSNLEYVCGRVGLYNLDDTSHLDNLKFVRDYIALGDNFDFSYLQNLDEESNLLINGITRKKKNIKI